MTAETLLLWAIRSAMLSCLALLPFAAPHGSAVRHSARWIATLAFLFILLSFPAIPAPRLAMAPEVPMPSGVSGISWLVPLWLCGMAICLFLQVIGALRLWQVIRESVPLPKHLRKVLASLGAPATTKILLVDVPYAPAACGLFRPVILVPMEALEWSREQWTLVLRHELAHVHSGDLWCQWLARIACSVAWINPAGWILLNRLVLDCEHNCDRLVVEGGSRLDTYARLLLRMASPNRSPRAYAAMARKSTLEVRIAALWSLKERRPKAGVAWVVLIFSAIGLAACALITPRPVETAPDAAEVQLRLSADPFPLSDG